MNSNGKKKYSKPRLLVIDPARLSRESWSLEQILQARALLTRALSLIEKDAASNLRRALRQIDSELARTEQAR